ncbi:hypothetical protein [Polynucleobacter sp. MG-27-Goln-C1]|uniref:hypothetical protein n=1 Tax=Polynucleobacter sp. MG-27-Goln-C1 TaxID=1819726 RepID=UPI001C0E77E1|nr:hypothetical protein [Polynucleobacter sp. MG-27-Goln-C1]MBU3612049.1 hypothetical protein [Polynucleobacter sp. MG-27-Goln-C1]
MRSRNRSIVILLCLCLISFKAAAGSIFVEAAIERAQISQALFSGSISDHSHISNQTTDGQPQSHTLFLMSHVTANISDNSSIIVPFSPTVIFTFARFSNLLFTQNFPDSAFKPPKVTT